MQGGGKPQPPPALEMREIHRRGAPKIKKKKGCKGEENKNNLKGSKRPRFLCPQRAVPGYSHGPARERRSEPWAAQTEPELGFCFG